MEIVSPEFDDGGRIPERFTCTGEDTSPALMLGDVPEGARSFAIVVDDPDARGGYVVDDVETTGVFGPGE